jgi:hypothetical protein
MIDDMFRYRPQVWIKDSQSRRLHADSFSVSCDDDGNLLVRTYITPGMPFSFCIRTRLPDLPVAVCPGQLPQTFVIGVDR